MTERAPLPLFTDTFIADTQHFSARETGVYLLLLMRAWETPTGRLPDDDKLLAKWAKVDGRTWLRMKPYLMVFWSIENGEWFPPRRHFGATFRTSIAPSIRARVLAAGACAYCGTDAGPFDVDHVVPLKRGGLNDESNLACACKPCNSSKRAKMLAEWMP